MYIQFFYSHIKIFDLCLILTLQLSAMLGAAVMCNTTVRRLVLDGNRLGLLGAVQLAAGLEANATLRSLRY